MIANVNLTTLPGNSAGDGRGHGTFVAGIAAGDIAGKTGAAPGAKLVSIDVMDDQGMARTSDVIAAADWILSNKAKYGIRVANFSLHSSVANSFMYDPLNKAVERLWFANVVVVSAAGNYGRADGPSGVPYAPGNDPFVITVGASDTGQSVATRDDVAAPWSAYGYTLDGFAKPDLAAPGRYMVGPVPTTSTLYTERPDHIVSPGYIELSGTSFAAPIVSGIAALILGRHPEYTPDQVKGALMARGEADALRRTAVGRRGGGQRSPFGRAAESAECEPRAQRIRRHRSGQRSAGVRRRQLGEQGEVGRILGKRFLGFRLVGSSVMVRTRAGRRNHGAQPAGRQRPGPTPLGQQPRGLRSDSRPHPGRTTPRARLPISTPA